MMLVELVGGSQPYEECRGISELITKYKRAFHLSFAVASPTKVLRQ